MKSGVGAASLPVGIPEAVHSRRKHLMIFFSSLIKFLKYHNGLGETLHTWSRAGSQLGSRGLSGWGCVCVCVPRRASSRAGIWMALWLILFSCGRSPGQTWVREAEGVMGRHCRIYRLSYFNVACLFVVLEISNCTPSTHHKAT